MASLSMPSGKYVDAVTQYGGPDRSPPWRLIGWLGLRQSVIVHDSLVFSMLFGSAGRKMTAMIDGVWWYALSSRA
jgi:hypothetical protein